MLKLQYFDHLMQKADSLEKTLMLGKTEGRKKKGWQMMRGLDGITDLMDEFKQAPGVGDGEGSLESCSPWNCTTTPVHEVEHDWATELKLSLWGYPRDSGGKESAWNGGDLGSIPGSGRSPGEGNIVNPLQYSCLENSMDRTSFTKNYF